MFSKLCFSKYQYQRSCCKDFEEGHPQTGTQVCRTICCYFHCRYRYYDKGFLSRTRTATTTYFCCRRGCYCSRYLCCCRCSHCSYFYCYCYCIRKSPVRIRAETVSIKQSRGHKGRDPQHKKKYHAPGFYSHLLALIVSLLVLGRFQRLISGCRRRSCWTDDFLSWASITRTSLSISLSRSRSLARAARRR